MHTAGGRTAPTSAWNPFLRLAVLFSLLAIDLAACQAAATVVPPEPTATPTATLTVTPTIVWFPPTATHTPFSTPVITPTLEVQPQVGSLILSDDFSDGSAWALGQTASSSIALGKNNLTLALTQPGAYLYTLRNQPLLNNFFLEINANTSLCRGEDEYGLLLRVTPSLEFYRFSLSCDGRTRLDKYFNGRASSPQPWTYSGAVPPGAPGSSRLSVWARGREMRFYINGELQFSLKDPSIEAGSLGLFIRSAGDSAVTVTFSDLVIQEAE